MYYACVVLVAKKKLRGSNAYLLCCIVLLHLHYELGKSLLKENSLVACCLFRSNRK